MSTVLSRAACNDPWRKLVTFVSLLFLTSSLSSACSITVPRYSSFNPLEYVFYGRVVGYVSKGLSDNKSAWGLKLDIVKTLNSPTGEVHTAEIYAYFIDSSACHISPISEANTKEVPIGTEYEVAAEAFPNSAPDRLQLDVSAFSGAVLHDLPTGTDISARYSFEADWSQPSSVNIGYDPKFEIRKDIIRLEKIRSNKEAKATLTRLVKFPIFGVLDDVVGFPRLVNRYLADPDDRKELLDSYREAWRLPDNPDLYLPEPNS